VALVLAGCAAEDPAYIRSHYNEIARYEDSLPYLRMTQIGALSLLSTQLRSFKRNDSAVSFNRLEHEELVLVEYLIRKHVREDKFYKYLDLDGYHRQYVGFQDKSGNRMAWVNFFCEGADEPWWRLSLVTVSGGGDCYLQIKINLTKGQVVYRMVNGNGGS
jgi:hypothetical protein